MEEKKIFIIEDDVNILYGLQAQLSTDFLVELSEGEEELEELISQIKAFSPDYLILDLILPKLDGFEVIKRIREDDDLSNLPIFIFTDLSDEDSKSRSLELGADYYFIREEFDIFAFVDKVKKIISRPDLEELGEDDDALSLS